MASLACTSCRAKKQRCDRALPSCMQCMNSQQPCSYPDQSKRGLPAGFLNAMESRLRETELALFYALSELHEGTIERGSYAGLSNSPTGLFSHLSKSEMMEKWANSPLGDRTHAKAWFLSHRAGDPSSSGAQLDARPGDRAYPVVVPTHAGANHDGSTSKTQGQVSPAPQPPARAERRLQSQGCDTFTVAAMVPPSTPIASSSNPNVPAGDLGLTTRAQGIAESNKRLYF